jgi:hypothetical protein
MRIQRLAYCLVFVSSFFVAPLPALAGSGGRSLGNLSTVRVVVEDLNQAIQQVGLRKELLLNFAVQRLMQDGLTVLKPEVQLPVPIVYIRLSSVITEAAKEAPASMYLNIQVKQFARLEHDIAAIADGAPQAKPHLVTTWENGTMVMTTAGELPFYTQNLLINLLADLVYDYQEASSAEPDASNAEPTEG